MSEVSPPTASAMNLALSHFQVGSALTVTPGFSSWKRAAAAANASTCDFVLRCEKRTAPLSGLAGADGPDSPGAPHAARSAPVAGTADTRMVRRVSDAVSGFISHSYWLLGGDKRAARAAHDQGVRHDDVGGLLP